MIRVEKLIYEYPDKRALNDISFKIQPGQITALVGPNGAGKTTLLRCLAALDTPFSGQIHIDGFNIHDKPRQAHHIIGYLSDFFGLYGHLTVEQCLTYIAWSHRIPSKQIQDKIDWVLNMLSLQEHRKKKAENLSRGLKQRLAIAQSIMHDPKVLLLDEPASGLDPEARRELSDLIVGLRDSGMTIIVSSHILAELEDYCTDMLIIRNGSIIDHVSLTEIEDRKDIKLDIQLLDYDDRYIHSLESFEGVSNVSLKDKLSVRCILNGDKVIQKNLLQHLIQNNVPVVKFTSKDITLQDAYMALTDTLVTDTNTHKTNETTHDKDAK